LLVVGPKVTGSTGQSIVLHLTRAIGSDQNLTDVQSVQSLYGAYAEYLDGQAQLGLRELQGGLLGSAPAVLAARSAATTLWGPPAEFVKN
jgi:hypothetical protein